MKKYIDLSKYDENQTITQLKKAIEQDEILREEKEAEEINRVKEEFSNVYLKEKVDCALFGETLNVYYLKKYVRNEKTTEYNFIHYFEGNKISFSKRDISNREFIPNTCGNSFLKKDLNQMTKISKEDYQEYLEKYNKISIELRVIINYNL